MLADAAAESVSYGAEYMYDRSQRRQKRDPKEIGISSIRGGTIVGDHTVLFAGFNEVIELHHSAQSRDCLAPFAQQNTFPRRSEPGLYDMQRLLMMNNNDRSSRWCRGQIVCINTLNININ